ncbi:Lrp/AsnC family transcriptional regulator [Thermobifida alba]|uniref:Lrp/AsnC family transcriptional regulator n=1 Tax=Thermobifida alba TaxID=53522 RepID=A0ABY4L9M1_THEAE|nr:Lrp/AsnC ligand binding domain-containing protein [Thermobifida alba]UPT23135.1 Lrp/AsnC family transcriptional regulator [Thermobifida alba]
MVQAYILIQTEVGRAERVMPDISGVEGVTRVDYVTGPYDVIVRAQAEDMDALGRLVIARIQRIDGIARTLTCPVVNVES